MTNRGRSPVTGGRFDLWIPGASMGVVTVTIGCREVKQNLGRR